MALTDKNSGRIAFFMVLILVIVIFFISFLVAGVGGIVGVMRFFFLALFVVTFFGFVFYIVYFLFFKKHKRDLTYINWKTYLKSALDNGADMMEDIVLMGDKYHSTKRFMTVKGYLRIRSFDGKDYDMFVGKRSSMNPFEDYKIILLRPDHHSDLIGDVYVYGISLIIKYGYYFLNTEMQDYIGIDQTVAKDTFRTLMFETLGDMKSIMDRATGLDTDYTKKLNETKLLKIPILSGQQQSNQQQGNQ